MARDRAGCRVLQLVLEDATEDKARVLASELRGHIWEAARCRQANHVLQKYVVAMGGAESQFIVDELVCRGAGSACAAARHECACRVLLRLLEHCAPEQVEALVEDLLGEAAALCLHRFGNFTVQQLLVLPAVTRDQRLRLLGELERSAPALAEAFYGCAVLSFALRKGAPREEALARSILEQPGLLLAMATAKHGHDGVVYILQALSEDLRAEARSQLSAAIPALSENRHGQVVVAVLQRDVLSMRLGSGV